VAAILCPRCRKLISSDEAVCPFCGLRRPGSRSFARVLRGWAEAADFSRWIVYVCAGVYVAALLSDPQQVLVPGGFMGVLAPTQRAAVRFGATGTFPVLRLGYWWTLVTAIYLHGGLLHILFNMMWVRQLGPVVERAFGPFRLFVIFTVAGVCGFLLSVRMGHGMTLGASGAIFGLLAAAIEYFRRTGAQLWTRQFLQWALIMFVFGLFFPGVDNWAHAGGFVGGYGTALVLGRHRGAEGLWSYAAAGACGMATVGAFVLQALQALGG